MGSYCVALTLKIHLWHHYVNQPRNRLQWKLTQTENIFVQEKSFEHVDHLQDAGQYAWVFPVLGDTDTKSD